MSNIIVSIFTMLSFLLSSTTLNIERSFLQNNPKMLYNLFSSKNYIDISLPEPISFSDQLSNQQAYFLFKRIFSSYSTFEFYAERPSFPPEKEIFILKARWSFRDKKNKNQFLFHIFFYLKEEKVKKNRKTQISWRITEIKAGKI
ncbi:MAG: hypothetical protein KAU91_07645 [Candidatus Aminicenantes bacterium]|nr:hypothetical protein [Candidatus Aminicenantes bacterium]